MSEDIAAIAKGLTKAQRRAVMRLPDVFTMYPVGIARVTIKRLNEAGLLDFDPPQRGQISLRVHRWSETGLAVRTYLMEHSK